MSHIIPSLVCKLAYGHDAWVVGSAAQPNINYSKVRDYDVMIPYEHWRTAAMLIPRDAAPNTFGGWKCQSDGVEVDVWPGDLSWLMVNHAARWAWHPRSDTRLTKY